MRKIALSRSLIYFLEEIEYSEAGLSADPDASSLAPAFQDALMDWETLFKKERLGRRNVVRAEALVAVRNERIDATTVQFGALARAAAPELLDRCFNIAPGKFIRRNLRKQCETTKTVIVPEIAKLAPEHPCKSFGGQLDALADGAVTALDDRAKAMGNRHSSANDVLEWKEGVNALRTTTYAELLKIAVAKGLPKSWVESFFRQSDGDTESDPDTESPPSTPNP
ncbi:MAG: hypothetical protein IPM54_02580 [Polyangiaceae bacterium]|nr:hypothetical protein [Polyangiaceae bacterium]